MYQAHWRFQQSPFPSSLNPDSFYHSPEHDEALARLNFLVDHQRRLGLLVGPSGCGKSLLLHVFAHELRRDAQPVAHVSLLDVEPTEFLGLLACQWGLNPTTSQSVVSLWRAVTDRLIEYRYQQLSTVILLDDADQANSQTLQHVARLVRFDTSPEMRLTVVLAGRDELLARVNNSLLDLADLQISLEPWQPTDTEQFLNAQLSQAGCQSPVFAEPAVERLHELAAGIPRRVSQLADLSLVAATGQNLPQIDAGVVESVYQELTIPIESAV